MFLQILGMTLMVIGLVGFLVAMGRKILPPVPRRIWQSGAGSAAPD